VWSQPKLHRAPQSRSADESDFPPENFRDRSHRQQNYEMLRSQSFVMIFSAIPGTAHHHRYPEHEQPLTFHLALLRSTARSSEFRGLRGQGSFSDVLTTRLFRYSVTVQLIELLIPSPVDIQLEELFLTDATGLLKSKQQGSN
jgi:hypothetical protein